MNCVVILLALIINYVYAGDDPNSARTLGRRTYSQSFPEKATSRTDFFAEIEEERAAKRQRKFRTRATPKGSVSITTKPTNPVPPTGKDGGLLPESTKDSLQNQLDNLRRPIIVK